MSPALPILGPEITQHANRCRAVASAVPVECFTKWPRQSKLVSLARCRKDAACGQGWFTSLGDGFHYLGHVKIGLYHCFLQQHPDYNSIDSDGKSFAETPQIVIGAMSRRGFSIGLHAACSIDGAEEIGGWLVLAVHRVVLELLAPLDRNSELLAGNDKLLRDQLLGLMFSACSGR